MARIFQDSAGTTPVTTYDQPVGKIVRGAGTVDLVQSVSASRLTMARWPRGGRRNLLTWTEDFTNTAWDVVDSSIEILGDGVQRLVDSVGYPVNATRGHHVAYSSSVIPVNSTYIFTVECAPQEIDRVGLLTIARAPQAVQAVDLNTGNIFSASPSSYAHVSVLDVSRIDHDWIKITAETGSKRDFTARPGIATNLSAGGTYGSDYSGDGLSGFKFRKPMLTIDGSATLYQRVTTANDVTEEGVETLWHLYNDGGDSLQTDGPVPAGTYGYAYVDPYGEITFDTRVSDGINPVQVADAPGRYLDLILRKGDFSAGEKVAITDYWERRYK